MRWLSIRRLGLRARVTLAFALGALLLTTMLSVATLAATREVLLNQRESNAEASFLRSARTVRPQLAPDTNLDTVEFDTAEGARPLIVFGEDAKGGGLPAFDLADVPVALAAIVPVEAARVTVDLDGRPTIVYGIQFPDLPDAFYYEAVSLQDIEDTLGSLSIILASAAAGTTLLAALFGYWASRRALAPLTDVSQAAEALASGHLETRIDPPADRDLGRLVGSFNEMAGALEERIERDARFASEVSHELRSPLMTITASLEVLENSSTRFPDRARQALTLLSSDLARFGQLVEDLLEISRFDVGAAALQADEVDICEFVRQAARLVDPDVPVVAQNGVEGTIVTADKRRLAQVVANLIDNAAKYGGGADGVEVLDHDDLVQIRVSDRGPGVAREERHLIFDRFSRGSAGGRRGDSSGSGLGLSLVAEHVRLHHGRVWVEDNPGGGARFVVEIPKDSP